MTLSEGVYRLAINDYNPDTDRIKWKENFPEIVKQKFGISPAISTLRGNIYETLKGKIAKGEFQQIIKKGRKSNMKPISLGAKYGLNKIGKFGGKKMSELDYICVLYEKFGRDWSLIVKKATKVGIVVPSMPKLQQCCYKRLAQISNS